MVVFERKQDLYWDCKTCGKRRVQTVETGKSHWEHVEKTKISITPAIWGFIRHRTCESCGTKLSTIEISLADLEELQEKAGRERFLRTLQESQIKEWKNIKPVHEQLIVALKDRNQVDERIARLIAESEARRNPFSRPSAEETVS